MYVKEVINTLHTLKHLLLDKNNIWKLKKNCVSMPSIEGSKVFNKIKCKEREL